MKRHYPEDFTAEIIDRFHKNLDDFEENALRDLQEARFLNYLYKHVSDYQHHTHHTGHSRHLSFFEKIKRSIKKRVKNFVAKLLSLCGGRK